MNKKANEKPSAMNRNKLLLIEYYFGLIITVHIRSNKNISDRK